VTVTIADRVVGCLKGTATGDAIGKQTEGLSREDVLRWYPHGVRGFEGAPGAVIPRYVGNSKREWRIGETTDDTERTVAVARAIIAERRVSHESIGREMLGCTKSVHPGVKSLWEFHQAADPARIAEAHDGCGAAIRVAPVGVFYTSDCLDDLVDRMRLAAALERVAGFWRRGRMAGYLPVIQRHWLPHLDGRSTLREAMRAIIADL
jgi:ADP-ribosylglycohydrolase